MVLNGVEPKNTYLLYKIYVKNVKIEIKSTPMEMFIINYQKEQI
jgi:hypothetical protein